ncbi:MAG: succinate dehydrogenase [Rhodobacterales bacterium]
MALQNFKYVFVLALSLALPNLGVAQENMSCPESPSLLLNSCKTPVTLRLRVLPDNPGQGEGHVLTVTGAYSSGDRFGIEGLFIQGGKLVSRRYKNWDGVLIVDPLGAPQVFHARDVRLAGGSYNLKQKTSRRDFIAKAKDLGAAVLQSHLLIADGMLDVSDVTGAPQFYRRMLVTFENGGFGIWQSADAMTLYAAALAVQDQLHPKMALNLDMGAYDFCAQGPRDARKDCGNLRVPVEKLTNLLEFTAKD